MKTLNFFEIIGKLDFDQTDYLGFYNSYLKVFSAEHYKNPIHRMQFITLGKEMKLFNHLQKIEELTNANIVCNELLATFIAGLVDRMFVNKEIDAILDANFLKVIKDIDELVQEEYVACTGKQPKLAVFDKDKMGDEIGASLEKDQAIANQFMKDYNKRTSRELADAFRKVHEIPTFEKVAVASKDVAAVYGGNTFNDSEDLFSSYPIEMLED